MLDHTDLAIIDELKANARMTMRELGVRVHLTAQAARLRVEKLEDAGIIAGYTAVTDPIQLGRAVQAFLNIYTKSPNHASTLAFFEDKKLNIDRIYKISGEGCYLVEVRFGTNAELNDFLEQLNEHANYKLSLVIGEK